MLQLVTPPTAEPLSLTQAKNHSRVTSGTAEDGEISDSITAARAACEARAQCQVMAARWKFVLDAFPGPTLLGVPAGKAYSLPGHAIVIPKGPVLQIASVKYLDMSGAQQTLTAGTDYVADVSGSPARITPPYGKIWPVTLPQIGAVEVQFDAGYAAPLAADAAGDTISVPGWKTLAVNDVLRVSNRDGAPPAPLKVNTDYYVKAVVSADKYQLAASAGGALIDITDVGTGDSFIGAIPGGLIAWLRLATGSLYENRESVTVDTRITSVELPSDFQDALLDPYRVLIY
jgi:uncharacterized phiE125 gp8 family phage protein